MDTAETPTASGPPEPDRYSSVQTGPEFAELRRRFRNFAFPVTVGFIAWYLLYVLLSNYAGGFMDTEVVGNVNMAFVLGLLQFVTTFLIAWWYSRHAGEKLDPLSDAIRVSLDGPAGSGAQAQEPARTEGKA
ncbi:DUF485 domain-containing protein [Streptomyces capparidis]